MMTETTLRLLGVLPHLIPTTVLDGLFAERTAEQTQAFVAAQNRRAREERAARDRAHAERQRVIDETSRLTAASATARSTSTRRAPLDVFEIYRTRNTPVDPSARGAIARGTR